MVQFYEVLTVLLYRSIHTVKFLLESVNLCNSTALCSDIFADKHAPSKVLSKKMGPICWYLWLTPAVTQKRQHEKPLDPQEACKMWDFHEFVHLAKANGNPYYMYVKSPQKYYIDNKNGGSKVIL